jgi:hypothetical protein
VVGEQGAVIAMRGRQVYHVVHCLECEGWWVAAAEPGSEKEPGWCPHCGSEEFEALPALDGCWVAYGEDTIAIYHGGEEVVRWVEDEWVEDSQVVFPIVHAVEMALRGELVRRSLVDTGVLPASELALLSARLGGEAFEDYLSEETP